MTTFFSFICFNDVAYTMLNLLPIAFFPLKNSSSFLNIRMVFIFPRLVRDTGNGGVGIIQSSGKSDTRMPAAKA